ncbi:MAG: ATP-binding protein [Bacteroidia bacterium]|nr:ATP-binding protein [Bacteroidia bacterium]
MNFTQIKTLGELKATGYKSKSVKDEMRENLIEKLKTKTPLFKGVIGYEDTVIPDVQRAILSRHNIILLGLRGQAKTRIARLMTDLLDEYIPAVTGSEINDDPLMPISRQAIDIIAEKGDDTPVHWIHRSERYTEKLATPDVTVADLIGDVDPIKAATLKLPYSDERVIHFGLIPRAHRGLFVINELPDLQARIQVSLFNILQEGDIQIRGFKLRFPLDIAFVFTANPEDYTHRGSIVTPLKDRIESQILTHYPKNIQESAKITHQEANLAPEQEKNIIIHPLCGIIVEEIAQMARNSEFVDAKSGVSARLTIAAYENLFSTAERRMLLNGEKKAYSRISDIQGIISAITGKIELVYEGEKEGAGIVARKLISKSLRKLFAEHFPNPEKFKKGKENPYKPIATYFESGNHLDLWMDSDTKSYRSALDKIPNLKAIVKSTHPKVTEEELYLLMEFVLFGMAEFSLISKHEIGVKTQFKDLLSGMMSGEDDSDDEDEWGGYYDKK